MVYNKLERSKGGAKMLFTNKKTDIATNRFGGDGDVIINHYIDEKLINDSIGQRPIVSMISPTTAV